jgi:hypothetical protein
LRAVFLAAAIVTGKAALATPPPAPQQPFLNRSVAVLQRLNSADHSLGSKVD